MPVVDVLGRLGLIEEAKRTIDQVPICPDAQICYFYKEPGSSWIQVRGSICYFFAGEALHPEREEIYTMLQILSEQMLLLTDEQDTAISFDP